MKPVAKEAMRLAANKLPISTKFVAKEQARLQRYRCRLNNQGVGLR